MNVSRKLSLFIRLSILVVLTSAVVVFTTKNRQDSRRLVEAKSAIESREFSKALTLLDVHLRSHPDDTEALLLAAETARRGKAYTQAAKYLRTYEQSSGEPKVAYLEKRRANAQTGDKEVAMELMRECMKEPSAYSSFLSLEAIAQGLIPYLDSIEHAGGHIEVGQHREWIVGVVEALLLTPMGRADKAEALYCSGRVHCLCLIHSRGVQDLRQAIDLAPLHLNARLYLANAIAQSSPYEALAHLELLDKLQPNDPPIRFGIASSRRALGHAEEAGTILDALLQEQPKSIWFLVERAQVHIDVGHPKEAERLLRQASGLAPDDPDVMLALSKCLRFQNRIPEADQYLQRSIELNSLPKRPANRIQSNPK